MEDIHGAQGPNSGPRVAVYLDAATSLTSSAEGQFNIWLSQCLVIEITPVSNVALCMPLNCVSAWSKPPGELQPNFVLLWKYTKIFHHVGVFPKFFFYHTVPLEPSESMH